MKKIFLTLALICPMMLLADKFGYVNTDELFQAMPEVATVRAQMDTINSQYESQLSMMQEEFQKKYQDYQQAAATMPDAIRQMREQELSEMQQRIQTFYQTAEQDIQKKQQELIVPIQEKMLKAIQAVGEKDSYTYIFDSRSILYKSAEALDVQPAVRKQLGIK